MAKSKEQKRQEALVRLEKRMTERKEVGQQPTFSQRMEHNALKYPKRQKTQGEKFSEKLFGPSDPVTGIIWANPLPFDFRPTPELEEIVVRLNKSTKAFVEVSASLDTPEGFEYPTYLGGGDYMSQWVSRHTPYVFHHSESLSGSRITVVFCRPHYTPTYSEDDILIGGVSHDDYERNHRYWLSTDVCLNSNS